MAKPKKNKGRRLPKFIRKSQFERMIEQINRSCITGCRNYAILLIMHEAGLRNSEVTNLMLADISFEGNGYIYVQEGKYGVDRFIPMTSRLKEALEEWAESRPDSDYFFSTMKGGQLDTRYIRELCYRLSEQAGVYIQDGKEKKKVNPHALRHSFATNLMRNGQFNIREVQHLLGHSDISTTQIYTGIVMTDIEEKFKSL